MPRDLSDVWRDEDGPHESELERWASGRSRTIEVDEERRRVLRGALKRVWSSSTRDEQVVIDGLLADLKA